MHAISRKKCDFLFCVFFLLLEVCCGFFGFGKSSWKSSLLRTKPTAHLSLPTRTFLPGHQPRAAGRARYSDRGRFSSHVSSRAWRLRCRHSGIFVAAVALRAFGASFAAVAACACGIFVAAVTLCARGSSYAAVAACACGILIAFFAAGTPCPCGNH